MFLRVSPEDVIVYANTALAGYVGVPKATLIGMPFEDLQRGLRGEMRECFQRPDRGQPVSRLVTDESGRVFEARIASERGVLDIVLGEVTHAEAAFGDLLRSTGTALESLTEDEIRILRHADRRVATVTVARMQGFGPAAERLPPGEAQLMLDAFAEETSEAILATGSTVGQMSGRSVTGIFGSPRYHRDHALRAVLSACLQIDRIAQLHDAFSKHSRELPPSSIAIATGEMLLAVVETGARRTCNCLGETVELAEMLSRLARPGEVVMTEATLTSMLANLPPDWESVHCETETEPDLTGLDWSSGEIAPPPESSRRVAWLIGPGVSTDPSRTELYIDCIFTLNDRASGRQTLILRVVRPAASVSAIELDENNVVSATAGGTFMGKYRLLEIVGEGGMGKVWRAEDRFGNPVAIKVLNSGDGAAAAHLERFRREAEIMARLPHRNICRIYEFGEFEGVSYIAMEYVDGVSLSDLLYVGDSSNTGNIPLPELIRTIRSLRDIAAVTTADHAATAIPRSRILPSEQSIALVCKICDAVQFAHEHGVLHRDLKPGNILLREDAEPLVTDFGLAKIDSGSTSLSVSGHVVGTVENMAPEQARSSKQVDSRADVFSIGTILYQLITGRKYFTATGNLVADAQALQTYEAPRPRSLNRDIDPDLEVIVMKALRSDREGRYATVAALHADLVHFQRGEPISARPVSATELVRKLILRHKAASAVTAASAVIFTTGLLFAAWTINERRLEAEAARELAEAARHEAEERTIEAEQARQLADERRRDAERALAEAEAARMAEREARGLHDQAIARAEHSDEERQKALAEQKRLAQLAEEQARRLEESERHLEALRSQPPEDTRARDLAAAIATATAAFQLGFTPAALQDLADRDAIFLRLNQTMDTVTSILLEDPVQPAALTLKARLHLAAMEVQSARATIGRALEAAEKNPEAAGGDEARALAFLLNRIRSGPGASASEVISRLRVKGSPLDKTTANLIETLNSMTPSSSISSGKFGRPVTTGEILFSLRANNPAVTDVEVKPGPAGGLDIEITASDAPVELSPLSGLDVRRLRIRGATGIDLRSLHSLPVETLDLSGCGVHTLGVTANHGGLKRLRTLRLSGTKFTDVRELARLPLLEELDISSTGVRSMEPLTGRQLRRLNIAECRIDSLNALYWLPLERLVVTPNLLPVLKATPSFRTHRTLRWIRTPDDPEDQTSTAFWRALDSGLYEKDDKPAKSNAAAGARD
jgi:Serine/threonine protein kinase